MIYVLVKSISIPITNSFIIEQSIMIFVLLLACLIISKLNLQIIKNILKNIVDISLTRSIVLTIIIFAIVSNIIFLSLKYFNRPSGPNILLIVPDSLRADHLGCYGYNKNTSPNIDKFAEKSLFFEKAMSNSPWTKPSIGSILTSLYPHEHKAVRWTDNLNPKCLTLAEMLRNKNYSTMAVQTNPYITKKRNFQQGFQHYKDIVLADGEKVTNQFISWLNKNKRKPFFAYLHYMDIHYPYIVPKEFCQQHPLESYSELDLNELKPIDIRILSEIGMAQNDKQFIIDLYDRSIKYFDHNFKRIIDALNKANLQKKTVVILISDHGEEFWDHKSFGHGHTLYRELHHVPLIINSIYFPAQRIKVQIQLLDLFPTLIKTVGIKQKINSRGTDLSPLIHNQRQLQEVIMLEGILNGPEKKAVLKGKWKLIENTGIRNNEESFDPIGNLTKFRYPIFEKNYELYNVNKDFFEKFNSFQDHKEIAKNLRTYINLLKLDDTFFSKKIKKTPKNINLEELKSLGYIK